MNKQELIEKIGNLDKLYGEKFYVALDDVLDLVKQLDEPEAGHADEAPRYVKNVLARLRELPLHDREVWLKAIMSEFEQDFSHAKWREGYEQGKVEGMVEREKVTVPQFVADFITEQKKLGYTLSYSIDASMSDRVAEWYWDNSEVFALAWILGYEVEKRYIVTLKSSGQKLYYHTEDEDYIFSSYDGVFYSGYHTKTDLEENGMSWIFDCEGVKVQEVE
ncbi:hypothetical protein Javan350_0022 [Streptococcus phage Javan350]|nr:hypothetical protein H354_07590 [Streptococcus oralis subsp. tigurinus AZ_3a]QBX26877.1 hypothetical protein Javan350_0022 [Streptococcus phage Javan350]